MSVIHHNICSPQMITGIIIKHQLFFFFFFYVHQTLHKELMLIIYPVMMFVQIAHTASRWVHKIGPHASKSHLQIGGTYILI